MRRIARRRRMETSILDGGCWLERAVDLAYTRTSWKHVGGFGDALSLDFGGR